MRDTRSPEAGHPQPHTGATISDGSLNKIDVSRVVLDEENV
jgi:hypothetical protein